MTKLNSIEMLSSLRIPQALRQITRKLKLEEKRIVLFKDATRMRPTLKEL